MSKLHRRRFLFCDTFTMIRLPECEPFPGRLNEICNGTAIVGDAPMNPEHVTIWRAKYGLPPIGTPGANNVKALWPPGTQRVETSLPSLMIRGWNFAAAMARWALAGMPRRTQEQIDVRLAICQACPALQNDHCTKCGCACVENNRLINKLSLSTEKCPDGKWQ